MRWQATQHAAADRSAATHRCTRNVEEPRRNRPGLTAGCEAQPVSVGACVAVREAGRAKCSATHCRVGDAWRFGKEALDDIRGTHWTRAEGGVRCGIVACARIVSGLKTFVLPAREAPAARSTFALPHGAVGRPVTWGQGPPHATCVASPCGRHSQRQPPHPLWKCPE